MNLIKLNLLWKRSILLFTVLCALSAVPAYAQSGMVRFGGTQASIGDALKQIEAQTEYNLAVSHKYLDVTKAVKLPAGSVAVRAALEQVLAGSGHTWVTNGKHIIIVPDKDKDIDPKSIPAEKLVLLSDVLAQEAAGKTGDSDKKVEMRMVEKTEKVTIEHSVAAFEGRSDYELFDTRNAVSTVRTSARPPRYAVKLNLLHGGALLTPNLGVEFGLGQKTSLDIYAAYNPWNLDKDDKIKPNADLDEVDNKKMVHTIIQPEFRYWLCERFNGHFFGVHAMYANYNVNGHNFMSVFDKDYRYEGYALGGGISYGYHLMLGEKWGLEFTVGAGIARMKYDRYGCELCDDRLDSKTKTYFGPTKAGISLVFNIK